MRNAITTLCAATAALLLFGLVLVFTASATQKGGASSVFYHQLAYAGIGLAAAFAVSRLKYGFWRNKVVLTIVGLVGIAACALVFKYDKINGSRRWIMVAGMSIQPSEFARIGLVMILAAWYDRIGPRADEFVRGALVPALLLGVLVAPVALSPDIGATGVMCVASAAVVLAGGIRKRWLFLGFIAAIVLVTFMVMTNENKLSRVMTYVDSIRGRETSSETGYHVKQSKEAFARGGWKGRGLGEGIQKYNYLPEANSDFIFASAAEEFGIFATAGIVLAFMVILLSGSFIAYHGGDRFGRLLGLGLTVLLSFEAAFNVGMVTGCLPTKGIALPFNSAGGSSLIASLLIVGLLVSIGKGSAEGEIQPGLRRVSVKC